MSVCNMAKTLYFSRVVRNIIAEKKSVIYERDQQHVWVYSALWDHWRGCTLRSSSPLQQKLLYLCNRWGMFGGGFCIVLFWGIGLTFVQSIFVETTSNDIKLDFCNVKKQINESCLCKSVFWIWPSPVDTVWLENCDLVTSLVTLYR